MAAVVVDGNADVSTRSLANAEFRRRVLRYKNLPSEHRRSQSDPVMLPPRAAPELDSNLNNSQGCERGRTKLLARKLDVSVSSIRERVSEDSCEESPPPRFYLGYVRKSAQSCCFTRWLRFKETRSSPML